MEEEDEEDQGSGGRMMSETTEMDWIRCLEMAGSGL